MANADQFRAAISGASNIQAPTSDPVLAKFYESTFQLPQSEQGAGALANDASTQVANAEIGRANKLDELKAELQKLQDRGDPNKFVRQKKEDGGFDFFDPEGNPITASEYARAKSIPTSKAVEGSDNLLDQQYQNDYDKLKDLSFLMQSEDYEGIEKFYEDNPGTQEEFKDRTIEEIWSAFANEYSNVYKQPQEEVLSTVDGQLRGMSPTLKKPSLGDRARGVLNILPFVNTDQNPYK